MIQYKDGSLGWAKLKDLKESNLIEVAKYAIANHLIDEPTFKWWVHKVIHCHNHIISKLKSWYWRTTHKFSICLPHSVEEVLTSQC